MSIKKTKDESLKKKSKNVNENNENNENTKYSKWTADYTNWTVEENGINLQNEKSLHSMIKQWYARPGDRMEVKVQGFIIDLVRDDLLIEIQTRNFTAIRRKLGTLVKNHRVRLVYPIPVKKWIVKMDTDGEKVLSRRKSPKAGELADIFNELIRMPSMINEENLTIEVLLIHMEEIQCRDGKGSWRRKGLSIQDRRLLDVEEQVVFNCKKDFGWFLPYDLKEPFSNKTLSESAGISLRKAQKVTYVLKKMGLIQEVGKKGNAILYEKEREE